MLGRKGRGKIEKYERRGRDKEKRRKIQECNAMQAKRRECLRKKEANNVKCCKTVGEDKSEDKSVQLELATRSVVALMRKLQQNSGHSSQLPTSWSVRGHEAVETAEDFIKIW